MSNILAIPRGVPNQPPLELDMALVDEAERRLSETRLINPANKQMLATLYNEASYLTGKYLGWIQYEILRATKQLDLAKAIVVLDKAPIEFQKHKALGVKFNEDFREALIARDPECQEKTEVLHQLQAVEALFDNKLKAFVRAHYIVEKSGVTAGSSILPTPNFNGYVGQTYAEEQNNFMGQRKKS